MPWVIDREYRGEWPQEPRTEHALIAHIDPDRLKAGEVVWSLIYVDLTVARQGVDAVRAAEAYLAAPKFKNAPAAAALDAGDGGQSPATDTSPVAGDVQPTGDTPCDTGSSAPSVDASTLLKTSSTTTHSSTSSGTTNSTSSPTRSSPPPTPTPGATTTPSSASSATTGADRDDLRRRVAALNPEQRARFDAHGFGRDTPTEVIAAALDDLAGFGQVSEPAAPVYIPAPAEPRRPVDEDPKNDLVNRVRASNVKDVINAWMVEGNRAGHPWNVMSSPYVDNWERTRAALHLAVQCMSEEAPSRDVSPDRWDLFKTTTVNVDTDIVRELLRHAIGDTAAEWPTVPIGAVIGQLTIDQARHAYNLADAFGTIVLPTWDADGHLQLSGVDRVAA